MFNVKYYNDMNNLADDLKQEILNYLGMRELHACSLVCKSLLSYINRITKKCSECNKIDLLDNMFNYYGSKTHRRCISHYNMYTGWPTISLYR